MAMFKLDMGLAVPLVKPQAWPLTRLCGLNCAMVCGLSVQPGEVITPCISNIPFCACAAVADKTNITDNTGAAQRANFKQQFMVSPLFRSN
jgi:hypothetical protein